MANANVTGMQEMKIKYGGGNEIEANTYINSLLHFTNVVQEINKGLSSDKKVEVKIKANKEGSFIVDIQILSSNILAEVTQILTKSNIDYAASIIAVVTGAYQLHKFLKGKKPKSIKNDKDSTISIENNDGEINVFDFKGANIYLSNPVVREAIAQEFETLEADHNVTDLEFLDKKEAPIFEAKREEFYELSSSGSDVELSKTERIKTVIAKLNISSLDLELKKKWDFYYLGNKISVKIRDDNFGQRIDKGERFGKGDTFEAKMEIKQEWDESVNAYVNKSYTIVEILDHIVRPSQAKIDFPEQP